MPVIHRYIPRDEYASYLAGRDTPQDRISIAQGLFPHASICKSIHIHVQVSLCREKSEKIKMESAARIQMLAQLDFQVEW